MIPSEMERLMIDPKLLKGKNGKVLTMEIVRGEE